MKPEDTAVYTENCIKGEPAPCTAACPFALDVRSFLDKTGKGRWAAAYKALRNATLFPAVVSALCPAECEKACVRTQTGDEPIAVNAVEAACVAAAFNVKPENYVIPAKSERIAVVGAGVAGLAAALCLAQKKYDVTVFDKNDGWGGSLRAHPDFSSFDADFALQFSATDAAFQYGREVTSLDELSCYDLVYVATGSGGSDFGMLGSWDGGLLATSEPGVFMGGALTGGGLEDAVAQGKSISKTAEVYLQTGKVSETFGGSGAGGAGGAGGGSGASGRVCLLDYSDEPPSPRVQPAAPVVGGVVAGYSADEARAESGRCFLCDCDKCMSSCEMLGMFRKKPKKMAMEVFTDTQVNPPLSTHTITRQVYSCNMCGHCGDVCPEDIDLGSLMRLSRAARAEEAVYPKALHDFWLREMSFSTGEAAFFEPPADGSGYVFFPGCQLGAQDPEYVFRSFAFMRERFRAGVFLSCCGAPAYWAGEERLQSENFQRIRETLLEVDDLALVFACATCESVFRQFLPEIRRVSLYELLDDDSPAREQGAAPSGVISPARVYDTASVFDPCNARKNPAMERAVRALVKKSGTALVELPEKNRCCGYGGHIRQANRKLFDTLTGARAAMAETPYIVYCANCREVFLSRGKDCAHILDFVFDIPRGGGAPKIGEKRENSVKVKNKLMEELTGAGFVPEEHEWDALVIAIDDELFESIDRKLIALSDIKEAIWLAEKSGDKFIDADSGVCQCSMEKPVLTYWVQYKKTADNAYEVYGAYYHRMRIGKEGG